MSLPPTKKDVMAAAYGPVFELWNYCPYLPCGERTEAGAGSCFCGHCGSVFNICLRCRATNRLLAGFCRGCGRKLETEVWPMEAGLRASSLRLNSIKALGELHSPFPLHLDAGIEVSPIAAEGVLFITQSDGGGVVLLSEYTGSQLGHLPVLDQIAVTPALRAGTLFVAAGKRLYAFELSNFLDQPGMPPPAPAWAFECAGEAISQPLLIDEAAVYLLARSGRREILEAVSQQNGERLWLTPLRFETIEIAPPVMVRDQLVLLTHSGEANIVQAATGELQQTFSLNRRLDPQVSPFVLDERVILADPNGYVFELVLGQGGPFINLLYDHRARISSIAASPQFIALGHMAGLTLLSSRGNLLWSSDTLESVSSTPIVAGESVFALDDAGNGLLFDVLKSNPVARVKLLAGEVGASPLLTRSHLVVVGEDGKVAVIQWH